MFYLFHCRKLASWFRMSPKTPVFFAVLCCAVLLASGGARAAEADTDEHGHAEASAPAGQQVSYNC